MDTQENGSGHTAGIRNAMLQKISKVPMAAENNMNVEVKHRMNNSVENIVQLCGHICGMRDGRMVKKRYSVQWMGNPERTEGVTERRRGVEKRKSV